MDTVFSLRNSTSPTDHPNGTGRPRAGEGTDSTASGICVATSIETQPSACFPMAFQAMLKTTTETGDIGIFSIKPSRVDQPLQNRRRRRAIPGNPPQSQCGPPSPVDDRRRLPSYTRDGASGVVSLSETTSPNHSRRISEDLVDRSGSIVHSSYSSCALSQHQSNASLRSQTEYNKLSLQRPRSPFAYPARLRRPGLRPSSPALTDGGLIDYSRRAEIERAPQGLHASHDTSSPLSLHAQRRTRPPGLRSGVHRSNPSLLGQSPHRSLPSQMPHRDSVGPADYSNHKSLIKSVTSSPARDIYCFTNRRHATPPNSAASAPARLYPPSPIYYDYTENFVDEPVFPLAAETLQGLKIKATLEDTARDGTATTVCMLDSFDTHSFDTQNGSRDELQHEVTSKRPFRRPSRVRGRPSELALGARHLQPKPEPEALSATTVDLELCGDRNVPPEHETHISMSGLGSAAQEPNQTGEASGHSASTSVELLTLSSESGVKQGAAGTIWCTELEQTKTSNHSDERLSLTLGDCHHAVSPASKSLDDSVARSAIDGKHVSSPRQGPRIKMAALRPGNGGLLAMQTTLSDSLTQKRRGRMFYSQHETSASSAQLAIADIRVEGPVRHGFQNEATALSYKSHVTPIDSLTSRGSRVSTEDMADPPLRGAQRDIPATRINACELMPGWIPDSHLADEPSHDAALAEPLNPMSNLYRQCHLNSDSRQEPPIKASLLVSVAKESAIKESVPHLMKALPPLPSEPLLSLPASAQILTLSSQHSELQSPFQLSDRRNDLDTQQLRLIWNLKPAALIALPPETNPSIPHEEAGRTDDVGQTSPNPSVAGRSESTVLKIPTKLRLRLKYFNDSRHKSSHDSLHEVIKTVCRATTQGIDDRQAALFESTADELHNSESPKFNLKVTRASSSTLGTVMVHRAQRDPRRLSAFSFNQSRDLFAEDDGLQNAVAHTSSHSHLGEAIMRNKPCWNMVERRVEQAPTTSSQQKPSFDESVSQRVVSLTAKNSDVCGISDMKSFFSDDSSHLQVGNHSLRKRLSNLKVRMATPYALRNNTHSYDDLLTREESARMGSRSQLDATSIPDSTGRETRSELKPARRLAGRLHASRMQVRLSNWLKEARAAISIRVKPRSFPGKSGGGSS